MVSYEYYDPTLGDVRDGNCYKRTYCFVFNKLYSEVTHLNYNSIIKEITNPQNRIECSPIKVNEFNLDGLFVVVIQGHVFPIKDGIIYDAISRIQQQEIEDSIIEELYEFPNYDLTDYHKYKFNNARYYIGGIILEDDPTNVIRIPLRPGEISEEESKELIKQALNSDIDTTINHKDIKLITIPSLDDVKFISDKVYEVCFWFKDSGKIQMYQKDLDEIGMFDKGDIFPVVLLNKDYGDIIYIELFGYDFKAIKLPHRNSTYILLQPIGSTRFEHTLKNYIKDSNDEVKY